MISSVSNISETLMLWASQKKPIPSNDPKVAEVLLEVFGATRIVDLIARYPSLKARQARFQWIHQHLLKGGPWEDVGQHYPNAVLAEAVNAQKLIIDYLGKASFPGPLMGQLGCSSIVAVKKAVEEKEEQISALAMSLFKVSSGELKETNLSGSLPTLHRSALMRGRVEKSWGAVFIDWCRQRHWEALIPAIDMQESLLSGTPPSLEGVGLSSSQYPSLRQGEDFASWLVEESLTAFFEYLEINPVPPSLAADFRNCFLKNDRDRREALFASREKVTRSEYRVAQVIALYFQLKEVADPSLVLLTLFREEEFDRYRRASDVFQIEAQLKGGANPSLEERFQVCTLLVRQEASMRSLFLNLVQQLRWTDYVQVLKLLQKLVQRGQDGGIDLKRIPRFFRLSNLLCIKEPFFVDWVLAFCFHSTPGDSLEPFLTKLHVAEPATKTADFMKAFLSAFHYKGWKDACLSDSLIEAMQCLREQFQFMGSDIFQRFLTLMELGCPSKLQIERVGEYFRELSQESISPFDHPLFLRALALFLTRKELGQEEWIIRAAAHKLQLTLGLNDWLQIYVENPSSLTMPQEGFQELAFFDLKPAQKVLLILHPDKTSWKRTANFLLAIRNFTGFLFPDLVYMAFSTHCFTEELLEILGKMRALRETVLSPPMREPFFIPQALRIELGELAASVKDKFKAGAELMGHLEMILHNSALPTVTQLWSDCFPSRYSKGQMEFKDSRIAVDLERVARLFPYCPDRRGVFRRWVGLTFEITLFQDVYVPAARTIRASLEIDSETLSKICPLLKEMTERLVNLTDDLNSPPKDTYELFLAHLRLAGIHDKWSALDLDNKRDVGLAYWKFVSQLNNGYRSAWAELSSQVCLAQEGSVETLAALGNLYEVEGGLSLLPPKHHLKCDPRFFLNNDQYKGLLSDVARAILQKRDDSFILLLGKDALQIEVKSKDSFMNVEMRLQGKSLLMKYADYTHFGPPFEGPLRAQVQLLRSLCWRQ